MDDRDDQDRPGGVQVVGRAIDILLAVARLQRIGATMPAITEAVGLNRSTCFRLVRYLTQRGLLEQDADGAGYFIGKLGFELGLASPSGGGLVAAWQHRLDRVRAQTGMTVYLVVRSDLDAVCLAVAEATSVVRVVPLVPGQRSPLGIGAGSLALLSACTDEEITAVLDKNSGRYPGYGAQLGPDYFWGKVRRARAQGYAESAGTIAEGVCGLGVTVPTRSDIASLAVSVSSTQAHFASADPNAIAAIITRSFDI